MPKHDRLRICDTTHIAEDCAVDWAELILLVQELQACLSCGRSDFVMAERRWVGEGALLACEYNARMGNVTGVRV